LGEVKKNAKRYNLTFKKELAKVLIHGILHLLDYDHERSEKAAKEMEEKQEHYLRKIYG
jgi:probable rRNA maturation factor